MSFVVELLPGCLESPTRLDLDMVGCAMLWPDDENRREAAMRACRVHHMNGLRSAMERWQLEILSDVATGTLPMSALQEDSTRRRLIWGSIAGKILHEATGQFALSGKFSLAAIFDRLREPSPHEWDRMKIGVSLLRTHLWPDFKPVAHLWAAEAVLRHSRGRFLFPCSLSEFRRFLSLAQAYLNAGLLARAPRSSQGSVLKPGEPARFPEYLTPPVCALSFSGASSQPL